MKTPSLSETQSIFWDLITAPEGVAHGLETLLDRDRRLPMGLDSLIVSSPRLSALDRLDVYANMYFFRLLDILREDFPAVTAVAGDVRFHNLVTDYLLHKPSTSPSVRDLGERLPGFLRSHVLVHEFPFLPDLAHLEWALSDAFDGPNAEPASADVMQQVAPEAWASMSFDLAPTLAVLRLTAPVQEVWQAVIEGKPIPSVESEATIIRVWRKEFRVLHRVVEVPEAVALDAVSGGEDFGGMCEAIAGVLSEEMAPAMAARILQTWFADGLVVSVR